MPLLRFLMQSRLQCLQEHTHRRDGTARSAHRVETSTSHICEASFGDEVGSRALQDAVVHNLARPGHKPRTSQKFCVSIWMQLSVSDVGFGESGWMMLF